MASQMTQEEEQIMRNNLFEGFIAEGLSTDSFLSQGLEIENLATDNLTAGNANAGGALPESLTSVNTLADGMAKDPTGDLLSDDWMFGDILSQLIAHNTLPESSTPVELTADDLNLFRDASLPNRPVNLTPPSTPEHLTQSNQLKGNLEPATESMASNQVGKNAASVSDIAVVNKAITVAAQNGLTSSEPAPKAGQENVTSFNRPSSTPITSHTNVVRHEELAPLTTNSKNEAMKPTSTSQSPALFVYSARQAMADETHYSNCESPEEKLERFYMLTGRKLILSDGTEAYSAGTCPQQASRTYKFAPATDRRFPNDFTSFVASAMGLGDYNETMLPLQLAWIDDIRMFMPHPAELQPKPLLNKGGYEFGINGEILRDIPALPRHISSAVEGWRLQYWFVIDKRITYSDIIARMHFKCTENDGQGPLKCGRKEFIAILESRIEAFCRKNGILRPMKTAFDADTYQVTRHDIGAITSLSDTQLAYGTWWVVDEEKGVMYPPAPQNSSLAYSPPAQYMLPPRLGMSPRVRKIFEFSSMMRSTQQRQSNQQPRMAAPTPSFVNRNLVVPSPVMTPMRRVSNASTASAAAAYMTPATTPASAVAVKPSDTTSSMPAANARGTKRPNTSTPKQKVKRTRNAPTANTTKNAIASSHGSFQSSPATSYGMQRQEAAIQKYRLDQMAAAQTNQALYNQNNGQVPHGQMFNGQMGSF
ncbi:hypothetical protein BU24DRAFT_464867 [Aaosphaeria arxii CBS 175.79]|uniref:Uncharacterized protein n=1 Tax=Aaosphaeria arxii CBS 175.79 TaxID=1450172 RepID=A0A6A5XI29_9PLEO|nr:uncharacterized protein BU24DRAFT_464867 [Aaosphaeria arxii CBS 175.79]KAF2012471.1 hypothetical protein BU24DRAFT_464867 [Aaosphaeria arxii CBS 175.79]